MPNAANKYVVSSTLEQVDWETPSSCREIWGRPFKS